MLRSLIPLVLLVTVPASAGWQANLKMHSAVSLSPGGGASKPQDMTGKAYGSGSKIRMDVTTPQGPVSILSDSKASKATALMHSLKMAMQLDFSKAGYKIPDCDLQGEACLLKIGYRKVGTESRLDQKCDVFLYKTVEKGARVNTKLWRSVAKSDAPFVRFANLDEKDKETSYVELTEVKAASPQASVFSAPQGYSSLDMGAMMKSLGQPGGGGKIDPSKLLEMLKKK